MMNYRVTENWNAYLDYFPAGSKDTYFTEEYVKIYETANDEAVCYVCSEGEQLLLFPYLRRKFIYKGCEYFDFETAYGYGGPIANTKDEGFITRALQAFAEYCKGNNYVCGFVRFHPLLNNISCYGTIGKLLVDRPTVGVNLDLAIDEVWMQELTSKNRNTIRKAISNGLEFICDYEFKYLKEFIALYNRTMNKVGADDFYLFPDTYYQKWRENINDSFLGTVKYGDTVVAGAIFFYSKEYGHYHLSGSNPEYLYLNPNNLLLWEAIKELKIKDVKKFHLGGGSTLDENNSLLEFKSRFSKNRYIFHIGKTMFNQDLYTEIVNEWIQNNPKKNELYKNHLLKYKY